MGSAFSRHWNVLSSAWVLEGEAAKSRRRYEQTEFLPAALEVVETPASPFGRAGLWFLILAVGAVLTWAIVGKLDMVVVAAGKIVPDDRVKVVQPSELGVIHAIHVREGQEVRAGQLLVELDPTTAGADDAQARTGLQAARIDGARSQAIVHYLSTGQFSFVPPANVDADVAEVQRDLVAAQIREYEARRGVLVRQRAEHGAESAAAAAEEAKLRETLPLLERQLSGRRQLAEKGYFSKLKVLEIEEQRIERIRNIEVQQAARAKAAAAAAGIDQQLDQLRSELLRSSVKDLAEARDNVNLRASEIEKTEQRRRLMRLASPVDGTVQQLSIHTLGGVVEPAQPLMVVVPKGGQLVIEAKVPNKDAGFVRVGQPVRVKIDAFPFTDYGTIDGRLTRLSSDAVEDEKLGLVYLARVRLATSFISDGKRAVPLAAGMAVSAEIKTGRRRIIQYLLSPIVTRIDEAGHER